jgi:Acetyltransferase (GNAT) domain
MGGGLAMLTLDRLSPERIDWRTMDAYPDRVIFQTREWLEFLVRTQRGTPVVAAVMQNGRRVGYFTGLVVRRFGVPILGSPFLGWTTDSMGFNLDEGVSRSHAAAALVPFAFRRLRCLHVELRDRRLATEDVEGLRFEFDPVLTYEVSLADDEAAIFGRMSSACRRAVRKAEKVGVTVEHVTGAAFAEEYHAQLRGVFARQGLVPTYGVERVRALIECLEPAGRLLLLRACSPAGRPIATGIFPAFNRTAYFWGGASLREEQIHRPNEAIFWHAMRFWRARGMTTLDLGGAGDYKLRYGPREVWLPHCRHSRVRALGSLRGLARAAVERRQRWSGRRVGQP